jgi:hypothetical protein
MNIFNAVNLTILLEQLSSKYQKNYGDSPIVELATKQLEG